MKPSIQAQVISYRQHFHAHPELGWLEYGTAAFVADELSELGFEVKKGKAVMSPSGLMGLPSEIDNQIAFEQAVKRYGAEKMEPFTNNCTAVAGILYAGEGPTVAIRVDMDALPIKETNEQGHLPSEGEFVSRNSGVMHACGHDAHTAIGLGLAHCLAKHIDDIKGTIILLFQPAEEGVRGAASIVKSGFLKGVDFLLAAHLWSNMPVGTLVCSQNGTAATDKLDVHFFGKSAHAGICPEKGHNAVLAAANTIVGLHSIKPEAEGFSRVNVGRMEGGSSRNIIADRAMLEIELRANNQEKEKQLLEEAYEIVQVSASAQGCSFEIIKRGEASGAIGDSELAERIKAEAETLDSFSNILLADTVNRGSEDFTSLMNQVQKQGGKACFIGVGAALERKHLQHHTPDFDIDEAAIMPTVDLFYKLVKKLTH